MTDFKVDNRNGSARLRVLLAEGSLLARNYFRKELQQLPFVEVVGEANTSNEALTRFFESRPDVVILSVLLPEQGGFEVLRCIKRAVSDSAVILTSIIVNPFVEETAGLLGATAVCSARDGLVRFRSILQNLWNSKSKLNAK